MPEVPRDIVWQSFSGPQIGFTVGCDTVRRYAPGLSAIVAFADPDQPDFDTLKQYVEPREEFYVDGWSGALSAGWTIEKESTMFKMIWDREMPEPIDSSEMVPVEAIHAERALELAILTNPGPFGLRTIELGDYFGYFDGSKLIALAGERFHSGKLREVSGVCTHPDYQGRGLAKKLMLHVMRIQMGRGQTPFLHVMSGNTVARGLYYKMGFRDSLETVVRVVSKVG